jgi:hypothetical protein
MLEEGKDPEQILNQFKAADGALQKAHYLLLDEVFRKSRPLTRSKKEQMKREVVKLYTCPMHPGVSSAKPGTCPMHPDQVSTKARNCPKCGMKMVVRKPTSDKADREAK